MRTGSIRPVCGGALEDIVSLTPIGEPRRKITTATLREKKFQRDPITCLTAYDYATARLVDEAGIDIALVGDSLAMTMLGYDRYLNYFREQIPTPDLVIYLQATPEVLKKRLKKKNAAGEKAISEDYLMEVVKAYEHFFFHYTQSDLLIVNTSEIDFVDRNEDLQELLKKVSAPIKGTQYFLPLGSEEAASA